MDRGNVHDLGQYQVVEQPWLIYEGAPQYGTYHNVDPATASFSFTMVGETNWRNKNGGNLANQLEAAPPAWLPLWTLALDILDHGLWPTRIPRSSLLCVRVPAKHNLRKQRRL
jgi:hypothetical protein